MASSLPRIWFDRLLVDVFRHYDISHDHEGVGGRLIAPWAVPRRTPVLLRFRAPGDARPTRPSPHPASQSADSACANHNLQSSCARLLSPSLGLFERTKSTQTNRADT